MNLKSYKEINVVYSFDDGYAQYAGISIYSLLYNNQEFDNINLYIIEKNISSLNKQKLNEIITQFRCSLYYLDLDLLTADLKIETSFNRSAYGRIFIANVLECDKVLYVDSDTIINKSLLNLYDLDLDGYLVAGVQDTVNFYYLDGIGLNENDRYINDGGIIILNLALWRKLNIVQKCIDFILKFNGNPPHNDQGTINAVCKGKIKILPANYNVMPPMFQFASVQIKKLFRMKEYYSQEELIDAVKNPIVIHYTDEFFNRPWFVNCTHPLKNLFLNYKIKTPWREEPLRNKELSKNCKVQNWVYYNCPFFVYRLMIKFIYWRHKFIKRII